jgi:hypothetical protein
MLAIVPLVIAGCGGGPSFDFAPVSGTVTMDGEPLSGAQVMFVPQAESGQEAGPASMGTTDASGNFTLTSGDTDGAVVGNHQVMITTVSDEGGDAGEGESDNIYAEQAKEKVPARYNSQTTLTFDVPADGSTAANFELSSTPDSGGGGYTGS